MNKTNTKVNISCHCGSIKMELLLPEKLTQSYVVIVQYVVKIKDLV